MFLLDDERHHVEVTLEAIVALYRSVNSALVALPGIPSSKAEAVVVGTRQPEGFSVLVALHLSSEERHLVFAHDPATMDGAQARAAAKEALGFVEAMGFVMENVSWRDLDSSARRQRLADLKVFDPPAEKAGPVDNKVSDPRTRLARLLAQI